jgi:hypothetical protein
MGIRRKFLENNIKNVGKTKQAGVTACLSVCAFQLNISHGSMVDYGD